MILDNLNTDDIVNILLRTFSSKIFYVQNSYRNF